MFSYWKRSHHPLPFSLYIREPYPGVSPPRDGERTHYSRKRSFLSPRGHRRKGPEFSRGERPARRRREEKRPREDYVGARAVARWSNEDRDGIFGEGTGRRGTRRGGSGRRTETEKRDPPAKGSYYNKFVGDLRSGNNSELRVTLRMCLSLLLFKWEWKATSCAGCDLHLRLAFSASNHSPSSSLCLSPLFSVYSLVAFLSVPPPPPASDGKSVFKVLLLGEKTWRSFAKEVD